MLTCTNFTRGRYLFIKINGNVGKNIYIYIVFSLEYFLTKCTRLVLANAYFFFYSISMIAKKLNLELCRELFLCSLFRNKCDRDDWIPHRLQRVWPTTYECLTLTAVLGEGNASPSRRRRCTRRGNGQSRPRITTTLRPAITSPDVVSSSTTAATCRVSMCIW